MEQYNQLQLQLNLQYHPLKEFNLPLVIGENSQ